jgi:hypothetical protein
VNLDPDHPVLSLVRQAIRACRSGADAAEQAASLLAVLREPPDPDGSGPATPPARVGETGPATASTTCDDDSSSLGRICREALEGGLAPDRFAARLEAWLATVTTPAVEGRYRVQHSLGQGGKGIVFLAHDHVLRREVAVKVIRGEGRERAEEFLAEARTTARLECPASG